MVRVSSAGGGCARRITGAPAAGDVFTVSQGQYRDIFETVRGAAQNLDGSSTAVQRDANTQVILDDLEVFLDRVLEIRTSIGGRLNALEAQQDTNEATIVATQKSLSALRDTDLAEAISQLSLEQTTLDAAQAVTGKRPTMVGYQAAGAAPFMRGEMVDHPETVATAIRIGHPQSWDRAWSVQKESDGWFDECTDEEILAAQKLLTSKEGIFCEPASATSVAGALRDIRAGRIAEGSSVVCTLTGDGMKHPDTAIKQCDEDMLTIDAELSAVKDAILKNL